MQYIVKKYIVENLYFIFYSVFIKSKVNTIGDGKFEYTELITDNNFHTYYGKMANPKYPFRSNMTKETKQRYYDEIYADCYKLIEKAFPEITMIENLIYERGDIKIEIKQEGCWLVLDSKKINIRNKSDKRDTDN